MHAHRVVCTQITHDDELCHVTLSGRSIACTLPMQERTAPEGELCTASRVCWHSQIPNASVELQKRKTIPSVFLNNFSMIVVDSELACCWEKLNGRTANASEIHGKDHSHDMLVKYVFSSISKHGYKSDSRTCLSGTGFGQIRWAHCHCFLTQVVAYTESAFGT